MAKKKEEKKEVACKKEAGGDAKHVSFFTWPYQQLSIYPLPNKFLC